MANPTVLLETTSGDILIELYADKGSRHRGEFPQICE